MTNSRHSCDTVFLHGREKKGAYCEIFDLKIKRYLRLTEDLVLFNASIRVIDCRVLRYQVIFHWTEKSFFYCCYLSFELCEK